MSESTPASTPVKPAVQKRITRSTSAKEDSKNSSHHDSKSSHHGGLTPLSATEVRQTRSSSRVALDEEILSEAPDIRIVHGLLSQNECDELVSRWKNGTNTNLNLNTGCINSLYSAYTDQRRALHPLLPIAGMRSMIVYSLLCQKHTH